MSPGGGALVWERSSLRRLRVRASGQRTGRRPGAFLRAVPRQVGEPVGRAAVAAGRERQPARRVAAGALALGALDPRHVELANQLAEGRRAIAWLVGFRSTGSSVNAALCSAVVSSHQTKSVCRRFSIRLFGVWEEATVRIPTKSPGDSGMMLPGIPR